MHPCRVVGGGWWWRREARCPRAREETKAEAHELGFIWKNSHPKVTIFFSNHMTKLCTNFYAFKIFHEN